MMHLVDDAVAETQKGSSYCLQNQILILSPSLENLG